MTPFDELKKIALGQKTITSSRLLTLLERIGQMIAGLNKTIYSQKKSIQTLNTKYQEEKRKADKRKAMVSDYEDLKVNHRNLKREHALLLQKYIELKGSSK